MSNLIITTCPNDLILVKSEIPTIIQRMDYATTSNFTGKIIPGYCSPAAFLTGAAISGLKLVQNELASLDLTLIIFDAYRPNKSVQFFHREWINSSDCPDLKDKYYPRKSKIDIFSEGFIAKSSSHSRGSAVDLSIAEINSGELLDMGSIFDFFDETSFTNSTKISEHARYNRMLLKKIMKKNGFINYEKEWWHFRLLNEPHPNSYFDFDIT